MKVLTGSTLALVVAQLWAASVQAADYPERNITVIVPFPAGGASDMTARLVTPKLAERVKQSVIIDNRARRQRIAWRDGAEAGARRRLHTARGLDRRVCHQSRAVQGSAVRPAERFRSAERRRCARPTCWWRIPVFPRTTFASLIEYLNKNPGKITFASSGTGSSDHLTAALFWQKTGTTGIHVPYRGGGPAINDLIAGHANVSFQNLGAIAEQVRAGRLKALAVTSDKRTAALPDVPTMAEAGVKDLEVYSWQAAAAPKGLPAAVKARLEAEFAASANSPDVKAKFEAVGFDVVASNGEQFAKFLADEIARWKSVIETGKITAE